MDRILSLFFQRLAEHSSDPASRPSPIDVQTLIRANLEDTDARHLMVITDTDAGASMVTDMIRHMHRSPVVIHGSKFPHDQNEQYMYRTLSRIILCIETGRPLILKDLDYSIFGSLYDLLNQNYRWVGNNRFCRVALGPYSNPMCPVHKDFRCVVVLTTAQLAVADPPFLNRLEKHTLGYKDILSAQQHATVTRLKEWITDISTLPDCKDAPFPEWDCFIGLRESTAAAVVYKQTQAGLGHSPVRVPRIEAKTSAYGQAQADQSETSLLQRCQAELLKTVPADAMIRQTWSRLAATDPPAVAWARSFREQYPLRSLSDYLASVLIEGSADQKQAVGTKSVVMTFTSMSVDPAASLPFDLCAGIQSEKLSAFKSERDFTRRLAHFFSGEASLLILQAQPSQHGQHLQLTKLLLEQYWHDHHFQPSGHPDGGARRAKHVCLILHMHRDMDREAQGLDIDFLGDWSQVTIDALKAPRHPSDVFLTGSRSISDALSRGSSGDLFLYFMRRVVVEALLCIKWPVPANPEAAGSDALKVASRAGAILAKPQLLDLFCGRICRWLDAQGESEEKGHSWQRRLVCDRKALYLSGTLHRAVMQHVADRVRVPLAMLFAALEREAALDAGIALELYTPLGALWTAAFQDESVVNIKSLMLPTGTGCYEVPAGQSWRFPFGHVLFAQLEDLKAGFLQELALLRASASLVDEDGELKPEVVAERSRLFSATTALTSSLVRRMNQHLGQDGKAGSFGEAKSSSHQEPKAEHKDDTPELKPELKSAPVSDGAEWREAMKLYSADFLSVHFPVADPDLASWCFSLLSDQAMDTPADLHSWWWTHSAETESLAAILAMISSCADVLAPQTLRDAVGKVLAAPQTEAEDEPAGPERFRLAVCRAYCQAVMPLSGFFGEAKDVAAVRRWHETTLGVLSRVVVILDTPIPELQLLRVLTDFASMIVVPFGLGAEPLLAVARIAESTRQDGFLRSPVLYQGVVSVLEGHREAATTPELVRTFDRFQASFMVRCFDAHLSPGEPLKLLLPVEEKDEGDSDSECPVCQDFFAASGDQEPCVLSGCGHSLCRLCMRALYDRAGAGGDQGPRTVRCPCCRKDSSMANTEFPKNWGQIQAIERLERQRVSHMEEFDRRKPVMQRILEFVFTQRAPSASLAPLVSRLLELIGESQEADQQPWWVALLSEPEATLRDNELLRHVQSLLARSMQVDDSAIAAMCADVLVSEFIPRPDLVEENEDEAEAKGAAGQEPEAGEEVKEDQGQELAEVLRDAELALHVHTNGSGGVLATIAAASVLRSLLEAVADALCDADADESASPKLTQCLDLICKFPDELRLSFLRRLRVRLSQAELFSMLNNKHPRLREALCGDTEVPAVPAVLGTLSAWVPGCKLARASLQQPGSISALVRAAADAKRPEPVRALIAMAAESGFLLRRHREPTPQERMAGDRVLGDRSFARLSRPVQRAIRDLFQGNLPGTGTHFRLNPRSSPATCTLNSLLAHLLAMLTPLQPADSPLAALCLDTRAALSSLLPAQAGVEPGLQPLHPQAMEGLRGLSPVALRVLDVLVHAALLCNGGGAVGRDDLARLLAVPSLRVWDELATRLEGSLVSLETMLVCDSERVIDILHRVVSLSCADSGSAGSKPSGLLQSAQDRERWEVAFAESFIEPALADGVHQAAYALAVERAAAERKEEKEAKAVSITMLADDLDAEPARSSLATRLWRTTVPKSFDLLEAAVLRSAAVQRAHPFLSLVFASEARLDLVHLLQPLLAWSELLSRRLSHRIKPEDAAKQTIQQFLAGCQSPAASAAYQALEEVIGELAAPMTELEGIKLEPLSPDCALECCLPGPSGPSLVFKRVVSCLARTQARFMRDAASLARAGCAALQHVRGVAISSPVPLALLKPEQVVRHTRDDQLLCYAQHDLAVDRGRVLHFDLHKIEAELAHQLLTGKVPVEDADMTDFAFHSVNQRSMTEVLDQLTAKVKQQRLMPDRARSLIEASNVPANDLRRALDVLLCFVNRTGADPATPLRSYCETWIDASVLAVQRLGVTMGGVEMGHMVSLYEAVEDAVSGVLFDTLPAEFKEPLSPALQAQLEALAEGANVEVFSHALRHFVTRCVEPGIVAPSDLVRPHLQAAAAWPVGAAGAGSALADRMPETLRAADIYHAFDLVQTQVQRTKRELDRPTRRPAAVPTPRVSQGQQAKKPKRTTRT